jgi:hypothetical protein
MCGVVADTHQTEWSGKRNMSFIDNIKSIPITDYAERSGFTLVKKGSRYVSLKEHDSVMIDIEKNAYWQNSVFQRGQRGGAGSVIDFAMEFNGYSLDKALYELAQMYSIKGESPARVAYKAPQFSTADRPKRNAGDLELPERAKNTNAVFHYLYRERGIDMGVIKFFLARKMLYQDTHSNCVFVAERFACLRSTGGERFAIDVRGCDYDECFYFRPSNAAKTLVAAESVIDIMSIMTQFVREGKRFSNYCYLALTGTNKLPALFHHLDKDKTLKYVMLAFDNDEAGHKATEAAKEELIESGYNGRFLDFTPPSGKDWNDYIRGIK